MTQPLGPGKTPPPSRAGSDLSLSPYGSSVGSGQLLGGGELPPLRRALTPPPPPRSPSVDWRPNPFASSSLDQEDLRRIEQAAAQALLQLHPSPPQQQAKAAPPK